MTFADFTEKIGPIMLKIKIQVSFLSCISIYLIKYVCSKLEFEKKTL